MVMEKQSTQPSAQSVGREFVRQYYTLLHEAPIYLHRFYSNNSCFVHGGVEKPGEEQPPVTGQSNIHKKILSLKFCDCHAKIRQVDSQPTVANAVVVQVTGELSNNGQPMRRFMQTFLLAPQSPKKYYVHNDIFRYQDEVFHDQDTGVEAPEDLGVDSEQENVETASQPETVQDPTVSSYYDTGPSPLSNGTAPVDERAESPEEKPPVVEAVEDPPEQVFEPEDIKEEELVVEPEPEQPIPAQESSKPLSWAALASQKPQQPTQQQPAPAASMQPQMPKPTAPVAVKPTSDKMPGPGDNKPQPQRAPRPPRTDRPIRDTSRSGANENEDPTRRNKYPDTHQLFVGNLPHNVGEQELQEFFDTYGKVMEVRINRKSSATNRDVPNFGFVVFQSPETVNKVLERRPIMMRDEIRLNVEEKKQRGEQTGRPGSGTRLGRGGPGMMGRGGMGPQRGGRGGGAPQRGRGDGQGRGGFGRAR